MPLFYRIEELLDGVTVQGGLAATPRYHAPIELYRKQIANLEFVVKKQQNMVATRLCIQSIHD